MHSLTSVNASLGSLHFFRWCDQWNPDKIVTDRIRRYILGLFCYCDKLLPTLGCEIAKCYSDFWLHGLNYYSLGQKNWHTRSCDQSFWSILKMRHRFRYVCKLREIQSKNRVFTVNCARTIRKKNTIFDNDLHCFVSLIDIQGNDA